MTEAAPTAHVVVTAAAPASSSSFGALATHTLVSFWREGSGAHPRRQYQLRQQHSGVTGMRGALGRYTTRTVYCCVHDMTHLNKTALCNSNSHSYILPFKY